MNRNAWGGHWCAALLCAALLLVAVLGYAAQTTAPVMAPGKGPAPELLDALRTYPHRIVFETYRHTNFEIFMVNADGSNPVNLTNTPAVDELYPKASPDGKRLCFVADEGTGKEKSRNLYLMDLNGTGRTLIATNAREPCWSADGRFISYLKGEFNRFDLSDFATKGLFIYDVLTGETRAHPNPNLLHLYCLNLSPDGQWYVATVHGGMGYKHAILAFSATDERVFDLRLSGCRPDLSPDGRRVAWGHGDWAIGVADLDFSSGTPKATGVRNVVQSADPVKTYHADWSPDGRYIAFSSGDKLEGRTVGGAPEFPGVQAPGWDICVADTTQPNHWVRITLDGASDKEPDWVPASGAGRE
ncbi:MAG: hypothetical protein QHJ73_04250 [Armatimonadota bacterium]|nr:hypothetical protein [Armatimonadota bacterium]